MCDFFLINKPIIGNFIISSLWTIISYACFFNEEDYLLIHKNSCAQVYLYLIFYGNLTVFIKGKFMSSMDWIRWGGVFSQLVCFMICLSRGWPCIAKGYRNCIAHTNQFPCCFVKEKYNNCNLQCNWFFFTNSSLTSLMTNCTSEEGERRKR